MVFPNQPYKQFVNSLVELSRTSVTAQRIRAWGHSERTNDNDEHPLSELERQRKQLFYGLDDNQKELIAGLLEDQVSGAIHNVASFLEHGLSCGQMTLKRHGENIPASPYASMHYDYVCRRQGDNWPDEETQ